MQDNDEDTLKELAVSEDQVKTLLELETYRQRIYDPIRNEAEVNITDEEAQQSSFSYVSISISGDDLTDDDIATRKEQAQEILDSATQDANSIRLSAITYTDDMMANIGSVLNQTLEDAGGKYKTFIDSLQSCLEVVNHNRQELAPQTAQAAAITGSYHDEPAKEAEDDNLLDDLGEE